MNLWTTVQGGPTGGSPEIYSTYMLFETNKMENPYRDLSINMEGT